MALLDYLGIFIEIGEVLNDIFSLPGHIHKDIRYRKEFLNKIEISVSNDNPRLPGHLQGRRGVHIGSFHPKKITLLKYIKLRLILVPLSF